MSDLIPGDVVQITDKYHRWFSAFITVTEPKSFGCMGSIIVVHNNDLIEKNHPAFTRLSKDQYTKIGSTVILLREEKDTTAQPSTTRALSEDMLEDLEMFLEETIEQAESIKSAIAQLERIVDNAPVAGNCRSLENRP